jgi:hypothetical protein
MLLKPAFMRRHRFLLQLFDQLPQLLFLVRRQVVFLILAVDIEQVEPLGRRHMEVDHPGPAAFAFATLGVGRANLP